MVDNNMAVALSFSDEDGSDGMQNSWEEERENTQWKYEKKRRETLMHVECTLPLPERSSPAVSTMGASNGDPSKQAGPEHTKPDQGN